MSAIAEAYLKPLARRVAGIALNLARDGAVDYGQVSLKARIGRGVGIAAGTRVDWKSSIGSYSFVGFNSFVTRAGIGRYCSIANCVAIGPGEHSLDRISTSTAFEQASLYDALTAAPCQLGNDVWIGSATIVRRGVTVGDGAIVGANSFVREDVPPFAVVAGSPARLIRFRFPEDQREVIQRSNWWALEPGEARAVVAKLEAQLGLRPNPDSR